MTLMLHAGAEPVPYAALAALPVPQATETHVPIAHSAVVDMVKYSLGFFGHQIVQEDYGVTPDGLRFFGVLSLQSEYGDYTDRGRASRHAPFQAVNCWPLASSAGSARPAYGVMHIRQAARCPMRYSFGMNVAETEVDMIPLEGRTPSEIAAHYVRLGNEMLRASELRYSRYNNEMLPWAPRGVFLREIAGAYFMEVEWCFYETPVAEREEAE